MPELPEVETVCRGLAAALEGRRLDRVEVRRPDLRIPFPPGFAGALQGRRVLRIRRRGKYFIWELDDGTALLGHLGMSGSMTIRAPGTNFPPPAPHDHVILTTDDGAQVSYHDPRRFGLMTLSTVAGVEDHPLLAAMGPEPLSDAFTPAVLAAALAGKNTPIKSALLDQGVVAGLGNIYVCEALFRARTSPRRLAANVGRRRIEALVPAIKSVLTEAIASGGSSLRDYRQATGELGYFQHTFAVYDREGQPCPGCDCGAAEGRARGIQRIVQAGRSTFFCAKRQR
ncbi:bifunctional DNA-formamidopyrimidine glycosylase/DNA-(apurinic or apyrimidinic site) lyase [Caenispirillum salinarum]|uniref:bifunctional DNA-formamidopyrimidine glycosylase/DNA-(apurinic or apyrimidinic site) lyase n=1 Tax=Caenispirillum salinarum TaxID=859058 RepID=UPI0038505EF3